MTDFDDFKDFEKDGWEERASTYGKWTVTSQIIPHAVRALSLSKDDFVLELASGPGFGANEISKKSKNVLGTDFALSMVIEAKKKYPKLKFEQADAEYLKFNDNSFGFQQNIFDDRLAFRNITCSCRNCQSGG